MAIVRNWRAFSSPGTGRTERRVRHCGETFFSDVIAAFGANAECARFDPGESGVDAAKLFQILGAECFEHLVALPLARAIFPAFGGASSSASSIARTSPMSSARRAVSLAA